MYVITKDSTGTVHLLRRTGEFALVHVACVGAEEADRLEQMLCFAAHAAAQVEALERDRKELEADRDRYRAEAEKLHGDLDLERAAKLAAQSDPTQVVPVTPARLTPPGGQPAGPFVDRPTPGEVWDAPTSSPASLPPSSGNGTPPGGSSVIPELTPEALAAVAPGPAAEVDLGDETRRGRRAKPREAVANGHGSDG